MKVIDLFNKVYKKELPDGTIFTLGEYDEFRYDASKSSLDKCFISTQVDNYYLLTDYEFTLDDEITIEEDKKIENIYFSVYDYQRTERDTLKKIEKKFNEIINKVNKLEEK